MSKYQIQRYKTSGVILDTTALIAITTASLNGKIKGIMANVPALTAANTLTLAITDVDGFTVFSKAAIVNNALFQAFVDANNQPLELPVAGVLTITLTASGNQTGAKTIPIVLLIETNR